MTLTHCFFISHTYIHNPMETITSQRWRETTIPSLFANSSAWVIFNPHTNNFLITLPHPISDFFSLKPENSMIHHPQFGIGLNIVYPFKQHFVQPIGKSKKTCSVLSVWVFFEPHKVLPKMFIAIWSIWSTNQWFRFILKFLPQFKTSREQSQGLSWNTFSGAGWDFRSGDCLRGYFEN